MLLLKQSFIIAQLLVIHILQLRHFRGYPFIAPLIRIEAAASISVVFKNIGTADIKLLPYDFQNEIDCIIQIFLMIQYTEYITGQIIRTLRILLFRIDGRSNGGIL